MNERETAALLSLQAAKNYKDICPETVARIFSRALSRYKTLGEAEKAARRALHGLTGAFMDSGELRAARAQLASYVSGDRSALERALCLHASTRERAPFADAIFDRVFDRIGTPRLIVDLACGLNPLYLGGRGLSVRGYDLHGGATALVCDWARACAWDVSAETRDLLLPSRYPACDLALYMKLLPLLEREEAGASLRLIRAVPARCHLITFPTRTLGGRAVGMGAHYGAWVADNFEAYEVLDCFEMGFELCYLLSEVR